MIGVTGNYYLAVSFGSNVIPLEPSQIRELTIIQDINKLVPEFRLRIADSTGIFTHLLPFDRNMSRVIISCDNSIQGKNIQNYLFDVYRRTPVSEGSLVGEYDIFGLLASPFVSEKVGVFSPLISKSYNQSIDSTIREVGESMGITKFNLSGKLTSVMTLIQANWTNAQFLQYLCDNLEGDDLVSNYRCWISMQGVYPTLNFLSYDELLGAPLRASYVFGDQNFENVVAVQNYEIIDNYKYLQTLGTKQQRYIYFDYDSSEWVQPALELGNMLSLSEYYMVDQNDDDGSGNSLDLQYTSTGRTNAFTQTFYGKVYSLYESRLNNLTKIWITTVGDFTLRPGHVVQLEVPQNPNNSFQYQYSGYWLVERIVLSFDYTIRMKLLLTRSGVNTSSKTTLVPATYRRT